MTHQHTINLVKGKSNRYKNGADWQTIHTHGQTLANHSPHRSPRVDRDEIKDHNTHQTFELWHNRKQGKRKVIAIGPHHTSHVFTLLEIYHSCLLLSNRLLCKVLSCLLPLNSSLQVLNRISKNIQEDNPQLKRNGDDAQHKL